MNKRQKKILRDFISVITVTLVITFAMIIVKDYINRSEAMRAMAQLGKKVLHYRARHNRIPSRSYIDTIKTSLEGYPRLGEVRYRAQWISYQATDDEILAYAEKKYLPISVGKGFIVLRLDGRVEWMNTKQFKQILNKQQGPRESKYYEANKSL